MAETNGPRAPNYLLMILNGVLGLMVMVSWWWVQQMTGRLAATELAVGQLQTWREYVAPVTREDHDTLRALETRFNQRDAQLVQALDIMRELKDLVHKFAADQIVQREALWRLEQRTLPPLKR
jgi:uncharacterized protein YPO0396